MGDDQKNIMTEMGERAYQDRSQAVEVQDDGALTQAGQTILTLHIERPGGGQAGPGRGVDITRLPPYCGHPQGRAMGKRKKGLEINVSK